ncbi:precorrin-6A reductase [Selenomonas sp.]|uniref:precorrin-6A reductase n=1 Tax=Selenomonas sp. TaxID=2053611 RepID=UPI003FA33794
MIFVAAGTQDGRELAGFLLEKGQRVTASVVSRYGEELLSRYPGICINDRPLDEAALADYCRAHGIAVFVDASHPYAANISANAMNACRACGIPYIRYERQSAPLAYTKAHYVADYEEAAKVAASLGKHVFLTTGSHNLKAFTEAPALQDCVLTARVLPDPKVVEECTALGLRPSQIVALQGPFSEALNEELYKKYEADVVVTKNGGTVGGADTKFAAAMKLGLPLVIVERPRIAYDNMAQTFAEVLEFIVQKRKDK